MLGALNVRQRCFTEKLPMIPLVEELETRDEEDKARDNSQSRGESRYPDEEDK